MRGVVSGLDDDAARFEPVAGRRPSALLDAHPDGRHVALQAFASPVSRAAVWDAADGRLVWAPADTVALCWTPGGREALLIRYAAARAPDHPPMIVSPLQAEYAWRLERRTWPGRRPVATCPLRLPTGWGDRVVASPAGDLAAVAWQEQDAAGVEFVALGPDGDRQVAGAGQALDTNWVAGPVFSPDGRFLLLGRGPGERWWTDGADADDAPSPDGAFHVGDVVVITVATGERRALQIRATVPAGWLPPGPEGGEAAVLGEPEFVTDTEFVVRLPTGERRRLSLPLA